MIVNTDIISVISQTEESGKYVSTIYFNNEAIESATFNESPERIYRMMNEDIAQNNKEDSTNK